MEERESVGENTAYVSQKISIIIPEGIVISYQMGVERRGCSIYGKCSRYFITPKSIYSSCLRTFL